MTQIYQEQIRNSPLWDEMVREFVAEKAEQLPCLRQAGAAMPRPTALTGSTAVV